MPYGILELHFFLGSFVSNPQYPFYSSAFDSSGHLLAAFAPSVASFTTLQTSEKYTTQSSRACDSSVEVLWNTYESISTRLRDWKSPQSNQVFDITPAKATATMIYQNALLIYFHSTFLATSTSILSPTISSAISSELQLRIEICLPLLSALYPTRLEGVLLWPSMIFGSCLKKENDIILLREGMNKARYKLRIVRPNNETWFGSVSSDEAERISWMRCRLAMRCGNIRCVGALDRS